MLVRLVDDFLFITLNRNNATKFLTTMYNGVPEYGAKIGIEKCLVNYETTVNGNKINRLIGTLDFPYCGNTIHTKTLDLKKDIDRRMDSSKLVLNHMPSKTGADSVIRSSEFPHHCHFQKCRTGVTSKNSQVSSRL